VAAVRAVVHDLRADSSTMPTPHESARSTTVYIVDDDAMVVRALARFLRSAGHTVETFDSAEAFLKRAPAPAGGCLLLDVCMPGMSGPELQLALLERGTQLELFFMSALDDLRLREQVLAAGARSWFSKPIDGELLLDAFASNRRMRNSAG
jgi:FixJ family two-component response regulator